jgi:hypothetical protein
MHSTKIILVTAITVLAGAVSTLAAPVNFNEVSLWVRAKETDKSILNDVKERKLAKALTPQQESVLKSQGASDSLVQSMRSPAVIASAAEVAASEVKSQPPRNPSPQSQDAMPDSPADNLHIFEVTSGHPINLSQWGGPDTEFAFNIFRYAGENIVEPSVIDTVRTYTDVATYIGPIGSIQRTALPHFRGEHRLTPYLGGDLKDDRYLIGDYMSAVSHSTSRGMSIDHKHPVYIKGVPYILYPIYGAGNTALYYIGNTSNSVTLAVAAAR